VRGGRERLKENAVRRGDRDLRLLPLLSRTAFSLNLSLPPSSHDFFVRGRSIYLLSFFVRGDRERMVINPSLTGIHPYTGLRYFLLGWLTKAGKHLFFWWFSKR
jgi:hypothetical protein